MTFNITFDVHIQSEFITNLFNDEIKLSLPFYIHLSLDQSDGWLVEILFEQTFLFMCVIFDLIIFL